MALTVFRRIHTPATGSVGATPSAGANGRRSGVPFVGGSPAWFGLHHKNAELEALKRSDFDLADWKRRQQRD
jgi:hypothetical protein